MYICMVYRHIHIHIRILKNINSTRFGHRKSLKNKILNNITTVAAV